MKRRSTKTQRHIDRMLSGAGERSDTSLRGKSLQRALGEEVPKTLTPYEWQEWYKLHGVPEGHLQSNKAVKRRWWQGFTWFKVRSKTGTNEH
ncbi:MAG: hypothetical protein ACJAUG_001124 [Halioglobus sp.]|jgi:hypothetical protein